MFYGGGWFSFLRMDEEQARPAITRDLLFGSLHDPIVGM
jgi:hypothetical protein